MVEEWQLSLKSEANRTNYRKHLLYFCSFHNTTAQDLIGKDKQVLKDMAKKYVLHLKKNAKSTSGRRKKGEIHVNSLPIYLAEVKSYIEYILDDEDINFKKIDGMLPEQTMSDVRAYTRQEIKKLMFVADERKRALMYIMLAGGVRREGVAMLKVSDFSIFDERYNIGMLWVYGTSRKWRYFMLLTPEATTAIQDYLKWREQNGERPIKPESPLIRDKFDVFTKNRIAPESMTAKAISSTMERLLKRAGIDDHRIAPDHSFRHWFDTQLINANLNDKYKKYWMGHKKDLGMDIRYFDPKNPDTKTKMQEEYLKAVDLLTINDENRLRRENVELKKMNNDSKWRFENLKKQLREQGLKVD
jgi:integrase